MSYEIQVPSVQTAVITPNPVNINAKITISVQVIEQTIALGPYYYYSGDLYAGEV